MPSSRSFVRDDSSRDSAKLRALRRRLLFLLAGFQPEQQFVLGRVQLRAVDFDEVISLLDLDAGEVHEHPIDAAGDARRDERHLPLAVVELADRANLLEQLAVAGPLPFPAPRVFKIILRARQLRDGNQLHPADRTLAGIGQANLRVHRTGPYVRLGRCLRVASRPPDHCRR